MFSCFGLPFASQGRNRYTGLLEASIWFVNAIWECKWDHGIDSFRQLDIGSSYYSLRICDDCSGGAINVVLQGINGDGEELYRGGIIYSMVRLSNGKQEVADKVGICQDILEPGPVRQTFTII
jgi:hypothetical protein